jgi:hypothetical protein
MFDLAGGFSPHGQIGGARRLSLAAGDGVHEVWGLLADVGRRRRGGWWQHTWVQPWRLLQVCLFEGGKEIEAHGLRLRGS